MIHEVEMSRKKEVSLNLAFFDFLSVSDLAALNWKIYRKNQRENVPNSSKIWNEK